MSDDLFAIPPRPATRRGDHTTSKRAADKPAPASATIRAQVLAFAAEAGRTGFTDDDLVARWAENPESSFRKRRSELTQEGWLVDSGRRLRNRAGNEEVVWLHRTCAASPPAVVARAKPAGPDPVKAEARLMAETMAKFAAAQKAEGRLMWSTLERAGQLLDALSR